MKPSSEITAIARPIRIAYIIEDGIDAHGWLNAAFNESFSRHGGRQTLVVPIFSGKVSSPFLKWLRRFDPDIVFLVAMDNMSVAQALNGYCSPLYMDPVRRPTEDGKHITRFSPRKPALPSISWLPYLKSSQSGFKPRPEKILDRYPQWIDDGLVVDNFGTLKDSFAAFPIHQQLSDLVQPMMLTPESPAENRKHWRIEAEEITDSSDVLELLSQGGKTLTLGYLSNLMSKPRASSRHSWSDSFCLFVGDSFNDRVCCWNSALLTDDAQHQSYKSLRLPVSFLRSSSELKQLVKFLNHNNFITKHGNIPQVTIRSASLVKGELDDLARQLKELGSYCEFTVAAVVTADECCPNPDINDIYGFTPLEEKLEMRAPLRHSSESAQIPELFQLKRSSLVPAICSNGQWIADYRIDRTNDHGRFDNIRQRWQLPQRNNLVEFHRNLTHLAQ